MKLQQPLKGIGTTPGIYITQTFGQSLVDYSQFGMKAHNGVDISCPIGTPIFAVHDGRIRFETEEKNFGTGYGKNVRLYFDEDGFTWDCIYAHLDRYEGEAREVKVGDVIGYSGNTGRSTGPHLHLGIRKWKDGIIFNYDNGFLGYEDPNLYLKGETMNSYVQTINYNGTIGIFVPVSDPSQLVVLNNLFNVELKAEADGTIKTQKTVKDV